MARAFVLDRLGRIVLPDDFVPTLEFSAFASFEAFEAVLEREFCAKAPTEEELLARARGGEYKTRYALLRDLARHLYRVERYALTLYTKRPTRWRDLPVSRDDTLVPVFRPWDGARAAAALEAAYCALPAAWSAAAEDRIFRILIDVFRHKPGAGGELWPLHPSPGELLAIPTALVCVLDAYDPDYPGYAWDDLLECAHEVPELEALLRQAMVLHNQYRWDRRAARLVEAGAVRPDDVVLAYQPRSPDALDFIRRVTGRRRAVPAAPAPRPGRWPVRPYAPVEVAARFRVMPRLAALAVRRGERVCTNEDLVRNAAWSWSPMSAEEILLKTGIAARRYTELPLECLALAAAERALAHAGVGPEEVGALVFCSCTSRMMMPSVAAWLAARLGMLQTHAAFDVVAACAGLPYGLAEAIRLLQEVERPVLVVCGEKFSDKIGTVRTSRMLFGDAAAALVIAPAPRGARPDVELFQTYAGGPVEEVDAIVWPDPAFDNGVTVRGPEVRRLVQRYLGQMVEELRALPHPEGGAGSLLDAIDLVVPHQANQAMVTSAARAAGLPVERLYFNIARVGNTSSASIPLALWDAVREGVIDRPVRVFTPAFGAGAVAGYTVLRLDPTRAAPEDP